ncbi:MAG: TlpA disulfide reductase family protein [Verrucomicrobiia bacterium]
MPGPRLVLPSLEGEEVDAERWRGEWVVLNFFARWSPGTIREIPDLVALQEEFASEGVRVVGVSVDETKGPVLREFVERMRMDYPVLVGSIETGNDFGGLESVPTTFILDRDWNVINRHTGQISREVVRHELRALLAEEARRREQKAAREAARAK